MTILLAVSRLIDAINGAIGRWVSWLLLAAVLISAYLEQIRWHQGFLFPVIHDSLP